jgi:IS5 family transposase
VHLIRNLVDAIVCPKDIVYPTKKKILNASSELHSALCDVLQNRIIQGPSKPRTFIEEAAIKYLFISKKKVSLRKELNKADKTS